MFFIFNAWEPLMKSLDLDLMFVLFAIVSETFAELES